MQEQANDKARFEAEMKQQQLQRDLKFIEHEYTNLFDDVEELINNTDDLKYHDMLKLDYEQLDAIIKRYFKGQYLQRIEEIEEENK